MTSVIGSCGRLQFGVSPKEAGRIRVSAETPHRSCRNSLYTAHLSLRTPSACHRIWALPNCAVQLILK
jgi:hypothetical protein